MSRLEALEHFRNGKAKEICKKKQNQIYRFFWENKDRFEERLREGFVKMVDSLQDRKDQTPISIIEITFLRVHILDGTYQWLVEAQDQRGSFDTSDRTISIEMSEFFGIWEELKEELKKEAIQYVDKLTVADCEQIVLQEFDKLKFYFYLMGIHAFRNIDETEAFRKLNKTPLFRITLGERRDKVQIIYLHEENRPDRDEIMEKLVATREEDFTSLDFVLRDFRNFEIEDCRVAFHNLSFSNLHSICIDAAEILTTRFTGADFDFSRIKDSQIDICVFHNASFDNAVIENTNFGGCCFGWKADEGEEQEFQPILYPVTFHNAHLKNVCFAGCDLRFCDFSKAHLEQVDFIESLLEGACFAKEAASTLNLTDEQRKGIRLV